MFLRFSSADDSSSQDSAAYQKRAPNRCEGVFEGELATKSFRVVSLLTTEKPNYEKDSTKDIEIIWSAPDEETKKQIKNDTIYLQANGLSYDARRYRMDGIENLEKKQFGWPIDLLKKYGPAAENLGVVGWTKRIDNKEIYLPLQVTQDLSEIEVAQDSSESENSTTYVLGVKFSHDYRKIKYTVHSKNKPSKPMRKIKRDYFISDEVIFLYLRGFDEVGIYRVAITAYDEDGNPNHHDILLYHEGV